MKLLLSTLGESPAVVTEAIDKLRASGIEITHISLLGTKDEDVEKAMELLYKHIPTYYQGRINFYNMDVTSTYHDIDTVEATVEFLKKACTALGSCLKSGGEVHVCIAGGRKTMSALLTLAVQFYGATSLFHIIVDPEIEKKEKDHIKDLYNMSEEELKPYLHPPPDKIKLVKLPFIGLFPLLDRIISTLKGEKDPEIASLLEQNKLLQNSGPTELGNVVLGILEKVKSAPEARSGDCEIHIKEKEPKERRSFEKYVRPLASLFFVKRIESIGWSPGKPKVEKDPPSCLKVYLPGEKVQNIGLRLITTAKTDGQLEFAKESTEELLKKLKLLKV